MKSINDMIGREITIGFVDRTWKQVFLQEVLNSGVVVFYKDEDMGNIVSFYPMSQIKEIILSTEHA